MAIFNLANLREKLSTSYSRTRYVPAPGQPYIPRDKLTAGDTLMSTICRPMMKIIEETPEPKGIHDTHNRMCNRFLGMSHSLLKIAQQACSISEPMRPWRAVQGLD